ncbi:MAG: hypothetical protein KIT58_20680, partial [Planctomycetota bacterium]|nr:hypothetical protein [Planctomycetota bacterium]
MTSSRKKKAHPASASGAGPEVLAVGEDELHAVLVGEAADVPVALLLGPSGGDLHAHERAEDGCAVHVVPVLQ